MKKETRSGLMLALGALLLTAGVTWYGILAMRGGGNWTGSFILCMLALPLLRMSSR